MIGAMLGTVGARIACSISDSVVGRLPTTERQIYLTIDDGPTEQSERIADILNKHGISATWFVMGESAERRSATVRHLADMLHQIGNHSYSHIDAWRAEWSEVESDLAKGLETIEQITGTRCRWTRPPYGRIRLGTLDWCRRHHQAPVLWDVLANDFRTSVKPRRVASGVRSRVRRGSIVVMHERDADDTLRTIEETVEGLMSDGWTFGRLPHQIRR